MEQIKTMRRLTPWEWVRLLLLGAVIFTVSAFALGFLSGVWVWLLKYGWGLIW